ncbi:MAG: glycosyltransferase family 4 protein [Patescibacteria group bacterium]
MVNKLKKAKIGVFVEAFPVVSETFIANKVKYLLDFGYDVQIFTLKESKQWNFFPKLTRSFPDIKNRVHIAPSLESLDNVLKVTIRLLADLLSKPFSTIGFLAYNLFLSDNHFLGPAERVFSRINFNGIQLDILSIEFDTLGYRVVDLKPILKCKVLINTVGIAQATNTYQQMPNRLLYLNKYVDFFRFASQFLRENSFNLGLSKNIKNEVVYIGVNPLFIDKRIKIRSLKNKKLKIISVGRLAWSKGYEFALEAIAIAKKVGVNIQYIIVGDGPYKDAVYYAAKQFNLLKNKTVIFKGALSLLQVKKELAKANVFLQASVAEGFGVSALEAQAIGLPVIATNAGGLPENIVNFKTGFIVPKRDPQALAKKIIYLYKDQKKSQPMGNNGRQRVRRYFTLNNEMDALMKIYKKLLEG